MKMKINDTVVSSARIPKSFNSPDIPPGTEGIIIQKDNMRDWLVSFKGVSVGIPVLEKEIELVPDGLRAA